MPDLPDQIASPMTLVMDIKSDQDYDALKELLDNKQRKDEIAVALTTLKTVHFARFVFLSKAQLAVITTYDESFDDYVGQFVDAIGGIFDALLTHMKDAPPLSVTDHRSECLAYVKAHDIPCVEPYFRAYPGLRAEKIIDLSQSNRPGSS